MSFRLPSFTRTRHQASPSFEIASPTCQSRDEPDSPLVTGILPENLLCLDGGRGLGVQLWDQWPEMLADLRSLGEALVITCGECAVLGKYLSYPALTIDPTRGLATDLEGEFDLSFAAWSEAHAIHLRTGHRHQYGIEFRSHRGQTIHKICLSADSRFEAFLEWVQIHQAVGPHTAAPHRRMPAEDTAEFTAGSVPAEAHVFADPARLIPWLGGAIERGLPIRALVGNEGVVQGHCFVPRSLREQGPWVFCSSDEVGLHLDPGKISRLVLHDIALDEPACWTLKAYDPSGQLGLALAPSAPGHRDAWSALTRDIFPALHLR